MGERAQSMTVDRLTNTGEKARRETGQQTGSRTRPPGEVRRSLWRSRPVRFLGHFLEMVGAMMGGMILLGLIYMSLSPTIPVLEDLAVATVLMAIFMTVPMVAWMRYRGHTWRQAAEMSASMLVPGVPLLAVDQWGPAHLAMLVGMMGLMLYRRDEYLDGRCHCPSKMGGGRA